MKVSLKLFASIREAVGASDLIVDLPDGVTLADLLGRLKSDHPSVSDLTEHLTYAVNRRYATLDQPLSDGDEVVILPPVAGGSSGSRRFEITSEPLDAEAVVAKVAHPGAGAIVTFQGVVREFANSGRAVTHLFYEAYPEMAEEQMAQIAGEIAERWGIASEHVAMSHRIGRLGVGEAAVVIAVASGHRREGFEACQYAIDRLKQIVPIWKKEIGPDGSEWVE